MAYPFAAAEVLTAVDLNAMIGAPTQNAQTGTTYTAVLLDAGKTVTLSNASAVTLTIPAQASVSWADNTQLNFLNLGAGTVTITPAADVTINGTPLTLETSKGGSLVRTASNVWTFIPFSSGDGTPGAANFTDTATGDYVSGGISYKYKTYTGSSSVTIDQAGFADILVIGGGASGGARVGGGGGAGGHLEILNAYLPEGTLTVTVGAGGASVTESAALGKTGLGGNTSRVGSYFSTGGGGGGAGYIANLPQTGGSGGGAASSASGSGGGAGAAGTTGLGNAGGTGSTTDLGNAGGGGAGAAAANATANNGSIGGAGASNSFTNTAVTRAGGGGGSGTGTPAAGGTGGGGAGAKGASAATAGTTNTGGGGGGHQDNAASGAGGSGLVIVRVVV